MTRIRITTLSLLAAGTVAGAAVAVALQQTSLDSLPPAARAVVAKIVATNPVTEVEAEEEDGAKVYEVVYTVADAEHTVKCAANGEILELEHAVAPAALPAEVQARLAAKYPGAVILAAEAVQVFTYEVELEKDGRKMEVEITGAGVIDDDDADEDEMDEDDDEDDEEDDDEDDDDDDEDDDEEDEDDEEEDDD